MKIVLDAGSGPNSRADARFPSSEWRYLRLDADSRAEPDIVGDIRNIPLDDEYVDAIWSSHVLEHLPEHGVYTALSEFHRVLKPGGELIVRVPDLKAVAHEIVNGRWVDMIYESPAGPVRPLDVVYGFQRFVRQEPLQGHRSGFTAPTLANVLGACGFTGSVSEVEYYELWAEAQKPEGGEREREIVRRGDQSAAVAAG